jgi:UDP-2-acetamido-3-amino-2,3-dideoxy-glucuronate N-acetyltransferase
MPEDYFVHDTAVVDQPCRIGSGTKIWAYAHIMAGAQVGRDCILGQNVFVDRDGVVGDRCKLQNNVAVYKAVILGDDVFCGPSMVFTNVINPRAFIERKHEFRTTNVQRGVTLGANATIVCGVTIGEYAMIGAGAVVSRNVKPYALMLGIPARQTGWVCYCGTALPKRSGDVLVCRDCGRSYQENEYEHLDAVDADHPPRA